MIRRSILCILANVALVRADIPGTMNLLIDPYNQKSSSSAVTPHVDTGLREPTFYENARLDALGQEILRGAQHENRIRREREEVSPYLQQAEAQRQLIDAQERAKEAEHARRAQELRQISELVAAESQAAANSRRQFEASVRNVDQTAKHQDTGLREAGMLLTQGPTLTDRELNAISLYPDVLETTDQNIPAWGLAEQARRLPTEGASYTIGGADPLPTIYDSPNNFSMVNEATTRLEKALTSMQSHCSAMEVENLGFLLLQAIREAAHGSQW